MTADCVEGEGEPHADHRASKEAHEHHLLLHLNLRHRPDNIVDEVDDEHHLLLHIDHRPGNIVDEVDDEHYLLLDLDLRFKLYLG